tara:strand:+ start:404 stop:904 length:501 start_codon:yes stop_codon:yes gene_type:complete
MKKLSIALFSIFSIANVSAATLTVDGGWQKFEFDGVGSSWSETFSFTLTDQALFSVTDAYNDGDEFSFTDGITTWNTSTAVNDNTNVGSDYDVALASPKFSSLSVLLSAGSYTITGLATLSPYGGGGAAARLSSVSAVPIPAAAFLFAPALLGFMGLRRKAKNSVA